MRKRLIRAIAIATTAGAVAISAPGVALGSGGADDPPHHEHHHHHHHERHHHHHHHGRHHG